jgi:Flp pilus assembly protein TadB
VVTLEPVLTAILAAGAVLMGLYAMLTGRASKSLEFAERVARNQDTGRASLSRMLSRLLGTKAQGAEAAARARAATPVMPRRQEDPLPWPFDSLDALQEQAGIYEGPMRITLEMALGGAGSAIAAWLLLGVPLITAAAGIGGIMLPVIVLRYRAAKRMALVEDQVSAVCARMAQALLGGLQVRQALEDAARATEAPLGDELRRVVRDVKVQSIPLPQALDELPRRLPGAPSLRLFVGSLQLALRMGANLAEHMEAMAGMLRDRRNAIAEVKAMTATTRTQLQVMFAIPILAFIWARHNLPTVAAEFATPAGQLKAALLLGWVIAGFFASQALIASRMRVE